MILEKITLLDEQRYKKYKSIIPVIGRWWWLKTPYRGLDNSICIINGDGDLFDLFCYSNLGGVRPFCTFRPEYDDPMFWHNLKTLIGAKIKYGAYNWTILDADDDKLYALCDGIIKMHCFDENTTQWEESELKHWLEAEGIKLITDKEITL